jgi:hypothetical protein
MSDERERFQEELTFVEAELHRLDGTKKSRHLRLPGR